MSQSKDQRYLSEPNLEAALAFIRGPLWSDMRRAAMARRPSSPDPTQPPHEAAARGFQRDAWEKAFDELEKLPFETPEKISNPFERPAVIHTAD